MGALTVDSYKEVYVEIEIGQSEVIQYLKKFQLEVPEILKKIGMTDATIHILPIEPKTLNDQRKIDYLTWAYNNLSLEQIELLFEEE
jgi:hypothetical protein